MVMLLGLHIFLMNMDSFTEHWGWTRPFCGKDEQHKQDTPLSWPTWVAIASLARRVLTSLHFTPILDKVIKIRIALVAENIQSRQSPKASVTQSISKIYLF